MMPRKANEAASNALSAPIPSGLKSSPASTGPTLTAMATFQPGDAHRTHPIAQGRDTQPKQKAAGLRVAQKPPVYRRDQAPSLLRNCHQGTALSLSSYFFCPAAHWLSPCAIGEISPPSLPRQDSFLLLQGKLIFLEILPCLASGVSQHLSQILARQRMLCAE